MDECVARRNVQPLYHLQLLFFRDSKFPGPPYGRLLAAPKMWRRLPT
jgi:hypothetical protein